MFKRAINFLDWLTREIPPPKSQPPAIKLMPSQLTPTEQAILDQAEESLRQLEIQSQSILQAIQEKPVIHPDPAPVQFLKVSEVPEVPITEEISEVPEVLEVLSPAIVEESLAVPEIPKIPEILAMVEPLQAEESTPAEQTPAGWAVIEGDEAAPNRQSSVGLSRKLLVEQHLEQAWADGFRTYDQLMNYVELATGKGCSKRVIAAWKKTRPLDEAVAA